MFVRPRALLLLSSLAAGSLGIPAVVAARTWHVPSEAPTIQAAVDSAVSGDDVLVAPGTYTWTNQGAVFPAMVRLKPGIWLHSESGAAMTILDGENRGRLVLCNNVGDGVVIEGLTIQNGNAPPQILPVPGQKPLTHENRYGGGLWATGNSNIALRNCIFQRNQNVAQQTAFAGAIACVAATIQDCSFFDNSARGSGGGGGAIYCDTATIERCYFRNNHASGDGTAGGGAIETGGGVIRNCTFFRNRAGAFRGAEGGAVFSDRAVVESCTFQENSVRSSDGISKGGALFLFGGSATKCTFVQNTATGAFFGIAFGGAINGGSSPTISQCVFIQNTAKHESPDGTGIGGAIVLSDGGIIESCTMVGNSGNGPAPGVGGLSVNGIATIRSVILSGSIGETCTGTPGPTWICSNLYGNSGGNAICGTDGGGNFSLDPLFCAKDPIASEDVTLQKDSPCAPGQSPAGPACGLIGAGEVTCAPLSVEKRSWSDVKQLFR